MRRRTHSSAPLVNPVPLKVTVLVAAACASASNSVAPTISETRCVGRTRGSHVTLKVVTPAAVVAEMALIVGASDIANVLLVLLGATRLAREHEHVIRTRVPVIRIGRERRIRATQTWTRRQQELERRCSYRERRQIEARARSRVGKPPDDLSRRQVVADDAHDIAQPRHDLLVRERHVIDRGIGRYDTDLYQHAWLAARNVPFAAREHGQRRLSPARAFDQHDGHLIGHRRPIVCLQGRPDLRHLIGAERLRSDLEQLHLISQIGGDERLIGIRRKSVRPALPPERS